MDNIDAYKLGTPDTEYAKMDILSRCEDLLSNLKYDRNYLEEYFKRYNKLKNHLDAIDRAIIKVEIIKNHYEQFN